jgi:hypothetical protein
MTAPADNAVADLQRANAELQRRHDEALAERDDALERETATAEVLQVINSSPGDLAPVFDAILEKAHILCGAALGGLVIFDGEQFRFLAAHGVPDFVEYSVRPRPDGNGPVEQLARGERLVHLADAQAVDAYRENPGFPPTRPYLGSCAAFVRFVEHSSSPSDHPNRISSSGWQRSMTIQA